MVGRVAPPILSGHLLAPWALAWLGLLRAARVLAFGTGSLCGIRVEFSNLSRWLIGTLSLTCSPRRLAFSGSFVCLGIRGSAGWHAGPGSFLDGIRVESTPSVTHLPYWRRRSRLYRSNLARRITASLTSLPHETPARLSSSVGIAHSSVDQGSGSVLVQSFRKTSTLVCRQRRMVKSAASTDTQLSGLW